MTNLENLTMSNDKSFDDFYAKFNYIANNSFNLMKG